VSALAPLPRSTAELAAAAALAEARREAERLAAELGCTASAWRPKPGSVEASWPDGALLLIGTPEEIRAEAARRGIARGSAA
jgi:hypothetical protein